MLGPFITGNSSAEWSGPAGDRAATVFFSSFPKNTNDCVYEKGLSGKQISHFASFFHWVTSTQECGQSYPMIYNTLKCLVNLKNSFRTLVHENKKDVVGGTWNDTCPSYYGSW